MLKLRWSEMHPQAREEACIQAGVALHVAGQKWDELPDFVQFLLREGVERKTNGKATIQ